MQYVTHVSAAVQVYLKLKDFEIGDYHLNSCEKAGNFLLRPLSRVFVIFNGSKGYLTKAALAVAGLFASCIGAFGFILKEIGELSNPKISTRNEALKIKEELDVLYKSYNREEEKLNAIVTPLERAFNRDKTPLEALNSLFCVNILMEQEKANSHDIHVITKSVALELPNVAALNSDITSSMAPDDRRKELALQSRVRAIYAQWDNAWKRFHEKLKSGSDLKADISTLQTLAKRSIEVLVQTNVYINCHIRIVAIGTEMRFLQAAYAKLAART